MQLGYRTNIPLLYAYSVLIKRVSMPIITLYFLLNNLSYTQIGILGAVMSVLAMATEMHGGVFADLKGKKTSLVLHSLFGALTMFFYFIGDSFWWFLVASVMYGLGGAFITGTRNALLYDTLNELGETDMFKKYNGRKVLYSHLVNAGVLMAIPFIYEYDPKLPFLIGIGFFLTSLVLALFFQEPPAAEEGRGKQSYNQKLSDSFKEILSNKKAISALIFSFVALGFIWMSSDFVQPLMQLSGLDVVYFGVVYALMRASTGFGAEVVHRLEQWFDIETLLYAGMALLVASFVGMGIGPGMMAVAAVVVLDLSYGVNRNILQDLLNKAIGSENRTTILSMSSLSQSLFKTVVVFSFGVAADVIGVKATFGFAAAILAVLLSAAFTYRQRAVG